MERVVVPSSMAWRALFALALPTAAMAADYSPCVDSKSIVGECWNVRGRVSVHNGNPSTRIWPVGSKRLLGVRDAEPPFLPPEFAHKLSWDADVFADLKVCPLTSAREGRMQIVCIANARNTVVRRR